MTCSSPHPGSRNPLPQAGTGDPAGLVPELATLALGLLEGMVKVAIIVEYVRMLRAAHRDICLLVVKAGSA